MNGFDIARKNVLQLALLPLIIGAVLMVGFFLGQGAADETGPLPKCAEDEALVPVVYPYTKGADLKCNDNTSIGGVNTDHGFCVIEANTILSEGFEVICK